MALLQLKVPITQCQMRKHQPTVIENHIYTLVKRIFVERFLFEGVSFFRRGERETFSDTRLLLPFRSSGAIQGSVPRTPPEISVWHFTLESPKSPTW